MNFLIDKTMPENMTEKLKSLGKLYFSANSNIEDVSVSTHPDTQIHFVNKKAAYMAPELYAYYRKILPYDVELFKGNSYIGRTYPECCAYNIASVGKTVICNTKYAEKNILEYYRKNNYEIIHINQGFAKCNICVLPNGIMVTEDMGIYNTLKKHNKKIYRITHGFVKLAGFEYGFIGGATGVFEDKLITCGNINSDEFKALLNKLNIEYIELPGNGLLDCGSIISF